VEQAVNATIYDQCAHLPCQCAVPPGETYCSAHCRHHAATAAVDQDSSATCHCGHPECQVGMDDLESGDD
jgi:hypothetical protein